MRESKTLPRTAKSPPTSKTRGTCPLESHDFLTSSRRSRKEEKEISKEIQAIIRQITASVTFLPLLDEPCERGRERRKEPGGLD